MFPDDVVVADGDGPVPIPAALLPGVVAESVQQERMEARIIAEVAVGVPLLDHYPPHEEIRARYAARFRRQGGTGQSGRGPPWIPTNTGRKVGAGDTAAIRPERPFAARHVIGSNAA